ncbi:MAG: hypothetical protein ABJD07_17450, partial [Gemmatimonadaceae bacterium]
MKYRVRLVGVLTATAALCAPLAPLGAQSRYGECDAGTLSLRDACYKAVDLFNYLAPQLNTSIAGGNATLGQGGTLGGFPHWSGELRASGMSGSLPQISGLQLSTAGQVATDIPVRSQAIGIPTVDAAIGLYRGVALPAMDVLGVDLLLSAAYVPTLNGASMGVHPTGAAFRLGYGARIGLMQESAALPGVSLTYMVRDLPTADVVGTTIDRSSGETDTVGVRGLSLTTKAWRLVASKSFTFFGLVAGVGQDRYQSSGNLSVYVKDANGCSSGCSGTPFGFSQTLTRMNYFADVAFNLKVAKLVGEIGRVSGGSV